MREKSTKEREREGAGGSGREGWGDEFLSVISSRKAFAAWI
jgi:hypothetical protein